MARSSLPIPLGEEADGRAIATVSAPVEARRSAGRAESEAGALAGRGRWAVGRERASEWRGGLQGAYLAPRDPREPTGRPQKAAPRPRPSVEGSPEALRQAVQVVMNWFVTRQHNRTGPFSTAGGALQPDRAD